MGSILCYSQNAIKVSFHQDLKLMAFGDNLGNRAGTIDIITRLEYESKEKKLGFFVFGLEYERALIAKGYTRYGAIFGYTFNNQLSDPKLYLTPAIGIGNIARDDNNTLSFSGSLQLAYKLGNRIKLSSIVQFTERTDLEKMYGKKEIRFSLFFGLEINLFKIK
ncbi:hypothetical protein BTO04_01510 [Polaribacter sp. SA4-10]|nr:hypothetical protein BTO04_01510 [Polaribacter sp. SA4-10]